MYVRDLELKPDRHGPLLCAVSAELSRSERAPVYMRGKSKERPAAEQKFFDIIVIFL